MFFFRLSILFLFAYAFIKSKSICWHRKWDWIAKTDGWKGRIERTTNNVTCGWCSAEHYSSFFPYPASGMIQTWTHWTLNTRWNVAPLRVCASKHVRNVFNAWKYSAEPGITQESWFGKIVFEFMSHIGTRMHMAHWLLGNGVTIYRIIWYSNIATCLL